MLEKIMGSLFLMISLFRILNILLLSLLDYVSFSGQNYIEKINFPIFV